MICSPMKVVRRIELEVPNLGSRIKYARKRAGRPLVQLAQEAGMSTQNWYLIEKEKHELPLETLRKIEEVLGVQFDVDPEGSVFGETKND